MKKNKIAILLVILLGSISIWLIITNQKKGTLDKTLSDFSVKDTASINKIMLADMTGKKIELRRIKPGVWKLNEKYIARNDALNNLLECIRNVEVRNPVAKAAMNNSVKKLASSSTKIQIYQNDNLSKIYFVGGETQDEGGTNMLLKDVETGENSSVPFVTYLPGFQGYLSVRYFTNEEEWKSREIFRYGPQDFKTVSLTNIQQPKESYSISLLDGVKFSLKKSDEIQISDFDTTRVMQYLTYYSNIQHEGVIKEMNANKKDSILKSGCKFIIKVSQSDGKEKQIKIYSKPPKQGELDIKGQPLTEDVDRMLGIVDDEKDFVIIQNYVFGKLLVGVDYFLKQKVVKK